MSAPKILALCGSLRKGSLNRKLMMAAVRELEKAGAEVDVVDLKALALPIYDGDDEATTGHSKGSLELRERIARADGIFLASPEYNHSIPGGLKNAIDWASRPPKPPFRDKVIALSGASPGQFGAVRAQAHLRQVCATLGMWQCTASVLLPKADQAFDEQGNLKDPDRQKELTGLVTQLLSEVKRRSSERV